MNISKALGTGIPRAFKTRRFRNMSSEEIKEKLTTELVVFMEFMDEILHRYEFKIGNYKVNNEFGEYTLEVLS